MNNEQRLADLHTKHLTYGIDQADLEPTGAQLLWLANEYIVARGTKMMRRWMLVMVVLSVVMAVLALINPAGLSGSEFAAAAGI